MSLGLEVILAFGFTNFGDMCPVGAQIHHDWFLLVSPTLADLVVYRLEPTVLESFWFPKIRVF